MAAPHASRLRARGGRARLLPSGLRLRLGRGPPPPGGSGQTQNNSGPPPGGGEPPPPARGPPPIGVFPKAPGGGGPPLCVSGGAPPQAVRWWARGGWGGLWPGGFRLWLVFFFNDPAASEISTFSPHARLPVSPLSLREGAPPRKGFAGAGWEGEAPAE